MNEELTLNDIVGFVEAFGPFLDRYFNSMNSISPEIKREMNFETMSKEIEQYEDGIRW